MSKFTMQKTVFTAFAIATLSVGAVHAQSQTPAPGDAPKSSQTSPLPATPAPDNAAQGPSNSNGSATMPMDHADPSIAPSAGGAATAQAPTDESTPADGKKHKKTKKHPAAS